MKKVREGMAGDSLDVADGGVVRVLDGGRLDLQDGASAGDFPVTGLKIGAAGAEVALTVPVAVLYTAVTPTEGAYFADRACVVSSIVARPQALATTAASLTFFKVPDGYGVASGTQVSTGALNLLTATANVNKSMALTADAGALTLAAGDALGYVVAGTPTAARGSITFNLKPV